MKSFLARVTAVLLGATVAFTPRLFACDGALKALASGRTLSGTEMADAFKAFVDAGSDLGVLDEATLAKLLDSPLGASTGDALTGADWRALHARLREAHAKLDDKAKGEAQGLIAQHLRERLGATTDRNTTREAERIAAPVLPELSPVNQFETVTKSTVVETGEATLGWGTVLYANGQRKSLPSLPRDGELRLNAVNQTSSIVLLWDYKSEGSLLNVKSEVAVPLRPGMHGRWPYRWLNRQESFGTSPRLLTSDDDKIALTVAQGTNGRNPLNFVDLAVWDVATGERKKWFRDGGFSNGVAFMGDGSTAFFSNKGDGSTALFSTQGASPNWISRWELLSKAPPVRLDLPSLPVTLGLVAGEPMRVRYLDHDSVREVDFSAKTNRVLYGHRLNVAAASTKAVFDPTGRYLLEKSARVTAPGESILRLRDANTGQNLGLTLVTHWDILEVGFSRDGAKVWVSYRGEGGMNVIKAFSVSDWVKHGTVELK